MCRLVSLNFYSEVGMSISPESCDESSDDPVFQVGSKSVLLLSLVCGLLTWGGTGVARQCGDEFQDGQNSHFAGGRFSDFGGRSAVS